MLNKKAARICYQIQLTGSLYLETPLRIGAGDTDERTATDIHVLKDKNERPFIPGTSLAGVLRSLVAHWDTGNRAANLLFGHLEDASGQGLQSAICMDDVELENAEITVRDGVRIDPYTQITEKGAKYDYEVVERGAHGDFSLLVTLRQQVLDDLPDWQPLVEKIARQLASGIRIGALTSKGLGRVKLEDAILSIYDFTQPADVQAWLQKEPPQKCQRITRQDTLPVGTFAVDASFALKTSLLVRSREVSNAEAGDKIHVVPLKSKDEYLIPGTSVKGVLRHQAAYILRMLNKPEELLDNLMGFAKENAKGEETSGQKSRFLTDEVYITPKSVAAVKQTRNAIDRFTGSTMDSKLFAEKALWQKDKTVPVVQLRFMIEACQPWEAGLALFLLKDLWTGHVALGGDKAVGRGYLQGLTAAVRFQQKDQLSTWQIEENGNVTQGDRQQLETYASALQSL